MAKHIHTSLWEKTPWYLKLIGKKAYRRKVAILGTYDMIDVTNFYWEYDD